MRYTAATEEAAVAGALLLAGVVRDDVDYDVLDRTEKGVTVRIYPHDDNPAPAPSPIMAPKEPGVPSSYGSFGYGSSPAPAPITPTPRPMSAPATTLETVVAPSETAVAAIIEDEADEDDALEETAASVGLISAPEDAGETALRARKSERNGYNRQLSAKARAQAQEFLNRMGLEAEARFGRGFNESTIPLFLDGPDVGIIIGKHGATLQSFQYLLNLTVNNVDGLGGDPEGGVRITVDAGKYRQRRTTSLEATARQAANKARREGRPIRLEPMPSHERRIVHLYLTSVAEVSSISEGKEPTRRVVITPSNTVPNPNFRPIMPARSGRSGGGAGGGGMGSFSRGRRPDGRGAGGGSSSGGSGGFNRGR